MSDLIIHTILGFACIVTSGKALSDFTKGKKLFDLIWFLFFFTAGILILAKELI